jgi:hypothetical protein
MEILLRICPVFLFQQRRQICMRSAFLRDTGITCRFCGQRTYSSPPAQSLSQVGISILS